MSLQLPLIFIPGLFGSLGAEIIPHTGTWHFGPSHYTGVRFIKEMERHGYILNQNLFIMFYDWRQSASDLSRFVLSPLIHKAMKLNHTKKVNLICHGTGGLIARYYAQSGFYDYSVNQLLLVGTPNAGFAAPFSYLSGGVFPYPCIDEPDFISLNLNLFLQFLAPSQFPALSEFLPSKSYGDYLVYSRNQVTYSIPYDTMHFQNTFLDSLNNFAYLIPDRGIHTVLIGGRGFQTSDLLEIFPACSLNKWADGKVMGGLSTLEGDSCTPLKSVFALEGQQYLFNVDYGELLLQTANLLPSIL
ncbi:MAG: hypothetical protein RR090_04650 [Niameybacter sp.]|uniref:esterase/lipase family protein n=1 Tax=Niameybacter sp. TaxID=2033640 RepID=UPI002FCB2A7A